jgi:hypothetical protein
MRFEKSGREIIFFPNFFPLWFGNSEGTFLGQSDPITSQGQTGVREIGGGFYCWAFREKNRVEIVEVSRKWIS